MARYDRIGVDRCLFYPWRQCGQFFLCALVALFLGIVNVLVRPFLILITLPINILTLGLFTFVINAALILLASYFVKGFQVAGFWVGTFVRHRAVYCALPSEPYLGTRED